MTDDAIELSDEIFAELVDLAGAMREDTIEDIEVVRLDQLLSDCPDAVKVYAELALLAADLHDIHGQTVHVLPLPIASIPSKPHAILVLFAIAAAAAIIVIGLFRAAPAARPPRGAVVATVTRAFDTNFDYGGVDGTAIGSGDDIHVGQYSLTTGIVELTYSNGAVVIVEAPAEFTLESTMLLSLSSGDLSARIPEQGLGFTVDTEAAKVVDLGTEFSVRATRQSSEIHVFEGEVVVESKAEVDAQPMHLFKGQASRVDTRNGTSVGIDAKPEEFLRVLDEPRHVYPRELSALNPIAYYRMRPHEANVLDDFVVGTHHGFYVPGTGAKSIWCPGRYGAAFRSEGPNTGRYAEVSRFPLPHRMTFSVVA